MLKHLPEGFVYLEDHIPDLVVDAKYFGSDNFLGRPVSGYEANTVICTEEAAAACARAAALLRSQGYRLVAWDGYRPRRAVEDFCRWGADAADQRRKAIHYPRVEKADMFILGYIAPDSSHCRGSALDVGLCDVNGVPLDLGTCFDYMDPASWPDSTAVPLQARTLRRILRDAMMAAGFVPIREEWWHFRLKDEPFPETDFDFPVK